MDTIPTQLELVSSTDACDFTSVHWLGEDILLSSASAIHVCHLNNFTVLNKYEITQGGSIVDVLCHNDVITCIVRKGDSARYCLERFVIGQRGRISKQPFKRLKYLTLNSASYFDVTPEGEILELQPDTRSLVLRGHDGSQMRQVKIPQDSKPVSFCVGPEENKKLTVLVADLEQHSVSKYFIEKQARLKWSCTNIRMPSVVRMNGDGYVFVSSYLDRRVHVISPEGK